MWGALKNIGYQLENILYSLILILTVILYLAGELELFEALVIIGLISARDVLVSINEKLNKR